MPVIDVKHDLESCSLTITAEFAAPIDRVWQIYADPRQLEKVWGPPSYPATVVEHDLRPGGRVHYYMTGPEGDQHAGWWQITEVEKPYRLVFDDGFSDMDFNPLPDLPVAQMVMTLEEIGAGTRVVFTSTYPSAEALQKVLEMGMIEGATAAMNQIDGVLAAT